MWTGAAVERRLRSAVSRRSVCLWSTVSDILKRMSTISVNRFAERYSAHPVIARLRRVERNRLRYLQTLWLELVSARVFFVLRFLTIMHLFPIPSTTCPPLHQTNGLAAGTGQITATISRGRTIDTCMCVCVASLELTAFCCLGVATTRATD